MPFEEIVYLAIDQVVVGPGHRPLGPLDQLVASMGAQGLINPVTVTPGFRLVAGRHRYEAARKLGWGHIPVIVRDLDEVEAILVRIDENLVRNDLTVLERAEALAKRKELYTAAQQGDWGEDRQLGYSATTAQALGVDQRTIQRYLQIAGLDEEVKASLAGHPLADSVADLTALSRLDPLHQAEVVSSVLAGEANTARDAIARLAEPPRPLGGQRWSVLAGELPETLPRPFLPLHPDGVAFLI